MIFLVFLLIILWLSISWINLLMCVSPAILYLWETKLFPQITPFRISSTTWVSVIVVGSPCYLQNFNFWTSTFVLVQESLHLFSDYIYNIITCNFPKYEIYCCLYDRRFAYSYDDKVDCRISNDYVYKILIVE
jgi:hypothetical protein